MVEKFPVSPPQDNNSEGPSFTSEVFQAHLGGKLDIHPKRPLNGRKDLSLAYTPGVAEICRAVAGDTDLSFVYTGRGRTVAIVTDGTAVLGLGDIGPEAALPVMEGKALLFKHFADIDGVPVCLDTTDVDKIVEIVAAMEPTFGGINLEDISAPRCFEIEEKLQRRVDIPVFHDDQHGTAIVTLAALFNGAKVLDRDHADLRVVISGAGAAGIAITDILANVGVRDIVVCDSTGVIGEHRTELPTHKRRLAEHTNPRKVIGSIDDALVGADVFIGVSGGTIREKAIATMADNAMVFAMANPEPEVHPDVASRHAAIVASGRSDFPNQINNVLAFPGVFRGALEVRATAITESMKIAAAHAIADSVSNPSATEIVPSVFDDTVVPAVAEAVAHAARQDGVARQ